MAVIFDSLIYDVALAAVFLGICLYKFVTSTFNYWKDRGVAYLEPVPFFGNLKDQLLGKKGLNETYRYMYDQMENEKFFGFFELRAPVLMIRDPELVEQILIKDFTHFYDRGFPSDPERDPLSANLSGLEGKTWRNLRYKLTPTFTTGKLKGMFEQICNCGEGLIKFIEEESRKYKAIESKPMLSTFAFEIIASVAFGLKLDKDNEVIKDFRKIVDAMMAPNKLQMFRLFALLYTPKLAKKLGVKQVPQKAEDAVMYLVRGTLDYRRKNNVNRNDFMQLLLNLQKQEEEGTINFQKEVDHNIEEDDVINQMEFVSKDKEENNTVDTQKVFMTDWMIAAQAFVFLTGGLETIASATNFVLFNLTQNPDIQNKVQNEIDSVLAHNHNKWSYQAVKEMVYLEQVIQESMRLYPIAPFLMRVCTESYKMPDTTLVVEKGTRVIIPVMGIHHNPQHYENPEVFDPDRFKDNNFKPSGTYLPFGDGPRICIAMRFAVLEVKMVAAKILEHYTVKISPKTKLPLTFRKNAFMLAPEHGFWFEFDKRVET